MAIQRGAVSSAAAPAELPDDPAVLQRLLSEARAEIVRLQTLIVALLRHRFGRRSERLDETTLQQAIEDLEQSLAEQQAKLAATAGKAEKPVSNTMPGITTPPR